ncbi:MAG: hypothetical protein WCA78_14875 [Rhizomicrobium sp.]
MKLSVSRLQWVLLALCGFLLVVLAYELFTPVPEWTPAPVARLEHGPQTVTTYPFVAPSIEAFAILDTRPAFNPLRTPLHVTGNTLSGYGSASGAAGSVTFGDLALIGIILDHGTKLALLRTPNRPLAVAVTTGAAIDGWQVVSIGSDRVVLRANGSEQELLLSANKAPATQQAAPPTQSGEAQ